jgi:hypothetical protein
MGTVPLHIASNSRGYHSPYLASGSKKQPTYDAIIWRDENRVSSDSEYIGSKLVGLPSNARELSGKWAKVDGGKKGEHKLRGDFTHNPFDNPESTVTNVRFDQVQLYSSLTSLALYLQNAGLDVETIITGSKNGRIVAHANKVDDLNAWYSPQTQEQTYGTGDGKWHIASDNDVTRHESGHFVLDQLAPGLVGWYSKDGGAIHEGFADSMSALIQDDPEVSEDFPPAIGKPASKTSGLRTVANDLTMTDVSSEVHDRGQVYGGFIWSIKEWMGKEFEKTLKISGGGIDPRTARNEASKQAAQQTMRLMVNHGSALATGSPEAVDFVRAMLVGAEALYKADQGIGVYDPSTHISKSVKLTAIKQAIISEAIKRKMIKGADDLNKKGARIKRSPLNLSGIIAKQTKKDSRIHFARKPLHTSKGIGVTREFYQQFTETPGGLIAEVVGSGFFVYRNASGAITGYSDRDVTKPRLSSPGIMQLMTPTRGPDVALAAVKKRAKAEYSKALQRLKLTKGGMPLRPNMTKLQDLKKAQIRHRIAAEAAQKISTLKTKDAKLIVLPRHKDVHYEFKMGLSLYYVNARTGKVTIKDDVMWQ